MSDEFVTPNELAKKAGVPRQMIFNYIAAGRIAAIRSEEHYGRWMIRRDEADLFLGDREAKATAKYDAIQRQLRGEE